MGFIVFELKTAPNTYLPSSLILVWFNSESSHRAIAKFSLLPKFSGKCFLCIGVCIVNRFMAEIPRRASSINPGTGNIWTNYSVIQLNLHTSLGTVRAAAGATIIEGLSRVGIAHGNLIKVFPFPISLYFQ